MIGENMDKSKVARFLAHPVYSLPTDVGQQPFTSHTLVPVSIVVIIPDFYHL